MRKTLLLLCTCVLALPMMALAQGQQGSIELTPWWDRPIVRNLGLSDDQLTQVRAVVTESRPNLIQLRGAVKAAETALADAMSQDPVDTGTANGAIDKVVSARGDLMRAISQMSLKLRQILTSAQWQELRKRGTRQIMSSVGRRQRGAARQQPPQ